MAYSKYYTRINWKNRPSTSTPLGETNLNHMDSAVDELDNRIVVLDDEKFNKSDAASLCSGIDYDTETGVFVFHYVNGGTKRVDLNIEKIPVSMSLSEGGILTITNADGTAYTANVADLLVAIDFQDSTEIDFRVSDSGKTRTVTAVLKEGSVTQKKLDPAIQKEIRDDRILAQTAASDAQTHSLDAKRYAVGGVIAADAQDNAKYYCEKAADAKRSAEESAAGAAGSMAAAATSEAAAKEAEEAAKAAGEAAESSSEVAHTAALNAAASENAAAASEAKSRASETAAKASETAALAAAAASAESETASTEAAGNAAAAAAEAKSWAGKAENVVNVHIATNEEAGIIKGNPDEISIGEDGMASIITSFTEQEELSELDGKESKKTLFGKIAKAVSSLIAHLSDKSNPHNVTRFQLKIENVDNTADRDKNVAAAVKADQDGRGQDIAGTYIKSFSVADRTITYIRGDGTAGALENTVTALVNNMTTTQEGQGALDAVIGKILADRCAALELFVSGIPKDAVAMSVLKSMIVDNFLSTDENTMLSGPAGKMLKEMYDRISVDVDAVNDKLGGITSPGGISGAAYTDLSGVFENTDLNDFKTPGFYSISSSLWATIEKNYPVANLGGVMEVFTIGSYSCMQKFYGFGGYTPYVRIFCRHYYGNPAAEIGAYWSPWVEYAYNAV